MAYSDPAPGATIGRTDEGVDWGNVKQTAAPAPGVITQVYYGLRGFGTTIIERIRGHYVYTALESSGDSPLVRPGQRVRAGQLTSGGGSGGGIEVGYWNPATGAAVAAPGYTEGKATQQGQQFRAALPSSRSQGNRGGLGTGSQTGNLSQLWIDAGGSPKLANLMAAIALAESGGDPNAKNSSGASGLWQIMMPTNAQYVQGNVFDPLVNARAAVAIQKSQGLGAWTTYTSGAYKQFLGQRGRKYTFTRTRPGGAQSSGRQGQGSGSGGASSALSDYDQLINAPRTKPANSKTPAFQWWMGVFQDRAQKVFGV